MGLCIDTGHFLRSGEDPVEVVRHFGSRVHGVHLTDVKVRKVASPRVSVLGDGDLDTSGFLEALRDEGFKG